MLRPGKALGREEGVRLGLEGKDLKEAIGTPGAMPRQAQPSRQHPDARTRSIDFRIGDLFPGSDPIARWATVLAMATNHMIYLNVRLIEGNDALPPETNIYYFRLLAAHFIEAVEWLKKTRRYWPQINDFIAGSLPTEAQEGYDGLVAFASQTHALHDVLKRSRVTLFHYPEMHPAREAAGHEELAQAMNDAADIRSSIAGGEDYASFRALFADEIALQFLARDEKEREQLREPMFELVQFTEQVLVEHLKRCPRLPTSGPRHSRCSTRSACSRHRASRPLSVYVEVSHCWVRPDVGPLGLMVKG